MKAYRSMLTSVLIMLATITIADDELHVITLHYRNAEDLIPLLQPLIAGEGAITGRNNQLIVRGNANQLTQIESVVNQLDHAPRSLLITVMQTDKSDAELRGSDVQFSIDLNNQNAAADVQTRMYSTTRHGDNTLSQQVHATDGMEAMIMLTQQRPQQDIRISTGNRTQQMETITRQQNLSSGFRVTPRINGNNVTLSIAPQRAREISSRTNAIENSMAHTTVAGKLGEWIEIGRVSHDIEHIDRHLLGSTHREAQRQQRWLVKVTEVK